MPKREDKPTPIRLGAAVRLDDEPAVGRTSLLIDTPQGLKVEEGESPHAFEMRIFAELDDGQRVFEGGGEDDKVILSTPIRDSEGWHMSADELTAEVREAIFDEDLQDVIDEVRADDPEFEIGPDWEPLIEALAAVGVDTSADELSRLPFTIELGADVLAALGA